MALDYISVPLGGLTGVVLFGLVVAIARPVETLSRLNHSPIQIGIIIHPRPASLAILDRQRQH